MAEVTMVESRNRRSMPFWAGFGVGVIFMLIAVIVFWFLGLVDIFPASNSANTSNTVVEENNATDEDNDTDEPNGTDNNDVDSDTNNTSNSLDNVTNTTSSTTSGGASVKVDGGTLTLAKDVDDSANPVDQTNDFSTEDDRIYIVFEITDEDQYGDSPELLIEWFKEDGSLSDFTYELPSGQSRVYFYQNNAGEGDYEVALSADGKEVGRMTFTVAK